MIPRVSFALLLLISAAGSKIVLVDAGSAKTAPLSEWKDRASEAGYTPLQDPLLDAVLFGNVALLPNTMPRLEAALRAAEEALTQLDLDGCLARVKTVDLIVSTTNLSPEVLTVLSDAHILAARAHDARGARKQAMAELEIAHRLAPDRSLDPARHSPRIRALWARASQPKPSAHDLGITTEPAGADLWLNGRRASRTTKVPLGRHYVTAALEGYESATVVVEPATAGVHLKLKALSREAYASRLRARLSEPGARVELVAPMLITLSGAERLGLVRGDQITVYDERGKSVATALTPLPPPPAARAPPTTVYRAAPVAVESTPWIKSANGITVMVVVGLVVVAAVAAVPIYVLARSDDGYVIENWCAAGEPCGQ